MVDHLGNEMRNALDEALREVLGPSTRVDSYQLFHAFKRAVARKCSIWERVPDRYVEPT